MMSAVDGATQRISVPLSDPVRRTTRLWTGLRALVRYHRVQLALSIMATIAALVSLALAQFVQFPLPLWAVWTAVMVTQLSVGPP